MAVVAIADTTSWAKKELLELTVSELVFWSEQIQKFQALKHRPS